MFYICTHIISNIISNIICLIYPNIAVLPIYRGARHRTARAFAPGCGAACGAAKPKDLSPRCPPEEKRGEKTWAMP